MKQEIKERIDKINRGEAPNGYKQTALGVFPSDWETKKSFGELFDFFRGLGKSREELGEEGICYLHYGDMHTSTSNIVTYNHYLKMPKYSTKLIGNESYLMKDGDIAFLDASEDLQGTSRAVMIDNPENMPFIAGLHTILAKEKRVVLEKYYKQYITIPQYVRKQFESLAVGFKVYGLNKETIQKIKICYPKSIEEQRKIAEILQTQDRVIELQENLLEQKQQQKQYLMQQLLTGKTRLKGFTTEWEKVKLGSVTDMFSGGTPKSDKTEYYGGTIPFIRSAEIGLDKTELSITELGYKNSSAKIVNEGDLLYALYGANSGDCSISKITGAINQAILCIRSNTQSVLFIFYNLVLLKERIVASFLQGGQGNLSAVILKNLLINLPPLDEQNAIAEILTTADREIQLIKNKIQQEKLKKKALMQLLLTGIVRVS